MTELAAGAVSSLLVVIRNEAVLLRGVQDDVQFIQEEMESMNSFLAHLARSAPPGGEHDEQVRTWMNQVRLLAQDCNNCIDLYLYRGNPDIHRAKGMFRRYLWWVYWSLHKLLAQHRAAVRLRQLKDRACHVGERRLRYGVEVPPKSAVVDQSHPAAGLMPSSSSEKAAAPAAVAGGYAAADDEDYGEGQLMLPTAAHHFGQRAVFDHRTLDDYVKEKLSEWVKEIPDQDETLSIAIVAPYTDLDALITLARETLVKPPEYDRGILVNIPAVHLNRLPLRPKDVLYYILWELKHAESRSQDQGKGEDEEENLDPWQDYYNKYGIYQEKKKMLRQINRKIENMKIDEKLDKIKGDLQVRQQKQGNHQQLLHLNLGEKKGADQPTIDVLLQLLLQAQQDQLNSRDMDKLGKWYQKVAKMLKKHIKADGEVEEQTRENKETTKQKEEEREEEKRQRGGGGPKTKRENKEEKKRGNAGKRSKEEEEVKEKGAEEKRRGNAGKRSKEEEEVKEKGAEERKKERKEENGKERGREVDENNEELEEKEEEEEDDHNDNDEEEEEEDDHDDDEEEEEEEVKEKGGEADGKNNKEQGQQEGGEDEKRRKRRTILLPKYQYEQILREVFSKTSSSKSLHLKQQDRSTANQAAKTMTTTLDEERIQQMIQEAIRELQEGKPDKNQAIGEPSASGQNQNIGFEETAQKIEEIKKKLKERLKIKGIVDKIKYHLKGDRSLIIFKVDKMLDVSRWEEFRKALSLLPCRADALIVTTTESIQQAKGYCYPVRGPIDYSLVGLYHDTVPELTSQQKNEDNYNPQIFRDILEACEPHEICMKIFTRALHANPKRSNEELCKLRSTLWAVSPKSFNSLTKVMFKFSYNDLPKEYKSCLLYLSIFPPEYKIRRSTLIGRWVAEGLTLKEDWPSSVLHAHQCFDALIHRCLVYPADIGITGKVKSCIVGDLFHGFITKIARKQHIVETRLSHHLARHFSIFNNLQLRSSDRIHKFFQELSKSSRISLLKVLDLEDCQCFGGKSQQYLKDICSKKLLLKYLSLRGIDIRYGGQNQRYLKDICSKMLLLKYLSLRGTDITYLPREINNLRELEILDIRQTKVPEDATANILLLKLKRLLAGNIDPTEDNFPTSVRVPHRIEKMVNIEVLSNVKAKHKDDLKDIGKLWQLRKLGVVIEDKGSHLSHLLRTISDLHECLRSLSITLPVATPPGGTPSTAELQEDIGSRLHECLRSLSITLPVAAPHGGTPSTAELPVDISSRLRHHPKILENLSISGTTLQGHLLPLFKRGDNNTLAKVTLSHTLLDKKDLDVLAELPRLRCVRLKHIVCTEPMLTFKHDKFSCLKCLLVEGSDLTNITFENGAAPELEKMVLSFTSTGSVSGVDRLPKLEELELNNSFCGRLLSSFNDAKQIAKLILCGTLLEQDALRILAKKPSLRCLVLSNMSFDGTQNQITFRKDEFIWLNLLIVDCSAITKIVFTTGSAPRLEKIVWSSSTSLSGINNLPRLKELEFNGELVPNEVEEVIKNNKDKLKIKHNKPETQDQAKGDEQEYDEGAGRFSLCWK